MAVLVQYLDNKPARFSHLTGRTYVIGRDKKACQLTLPSPSVSRIHARIEIEPPYFYLCDLSRNGTLVNGRRVTGTQLLNDGDEIAISNEIYRFYIDVPLDLSSQLSLGSDANRPVALATVDSDDSIRHAHVSPGLQIFQPDDEHRSVPHHKIVSRLKISTDMSSLATSGDVTRKLLLTLQCLQRLRSTISELEVVQKAVQHLREIFSSFDSIVIVRYSRHADRLDVIATHSAESEPYAKLGLPLVEQSINDRDAILMQDQWRNSSSSHPGISDLTKHSLMCCPLLFSDETVYGVVHLETGRSDFSPDRTDLERLAMVTHLIGICLEQSLLAHELVLSSGLDRSTEMARSFRVHFPGSEAPSIPGYLLRRYMISAPNMAAADLVDFVSLGQNRTAVILIDVPGRDAGAASLMACLSRLMTNALTESGSPAQAIRSTEQTLLDRMNLIPIKISLAVAVLDNQRGTVVLSVSGSCPVFLHDGNKATQLNSSDITDTRDGLSRNDYRETEIPLHERGSLLLLSDGVPRLLSSSGESLNHRELLRMIEHSLAAPADSHIRLADQLHAFRSGASLPDDIVFSVIHRLPSLRSDFEPSPISLDSPETR